MECHPRCDVSLPALGTRKVTTSFSAACSSGRNPLNKSPLELTISINQDVRSLSVFKISKEPRLNTRNIGTQHWPLRLDVQFYERNPNNIYIKACVHTEQAGDEKCFMDHLYSKDEVMETACGPREPAMPLMLVSALFAFLFLLLIMAAMVVVYRIYQRVHRGKRGQLDVECRRPPEVKTQLVTPRTLHAQLTIIEEEEPSRAPSPVSPSMSRSVSPTTGMTNGNGSRRSTRGKKDKQDLIAICSSPTIKKPSFV